MPDPRTPPLTVRTPVATAAAATALAVAAALLLAASGGRDVTLLPVAAGDRDFRASLGDVAFRDALPPTSVTTYTWSPGDETVAAWRTTATAAGLSERVAEQPALATSVPTGAEELRVGAPVPGAGEIVGLGGALTDAAAYLLDTSPHRDAALDALFGDAGADLDVVRVPMGATDMESGAVHTSYVDTPDPTLESFSVERDLAHVVPVLRSALAIEPDLTVVAAPWSAPGWMKNSGRYVGECRGRQNHLRDDAYDVYALYYVRFLQEYAALGVDVAQVSLGNEPQHCDPSYPTMTMTSDEQARLATTLRPALDAAGFADVEILGWDHNHVDQGTNTPTRYPDRLVAAAGDSVDAIGYHCYESDRLASPAATQTTLRPVWMTECTGTLTWRDTRQNLVNETHLALLDPLRHGAVASLYWNLALDASGGPHLGGCRVCRGMLVVDGATVEVGESLTYWSQLSRFVEPGARLLSSTQRRPVETAAFENPDGSRVLVVLNTSWSTLGWGTPAEPTVVPTAAPTVAPTTTPTTAPTTPPAHEPATGPVAGLLGGLGRLVRGLLPF